MTKMDESPSQNIIGNIEHIVADDLRFKAKLHIGDDAYGSKRVMNSAIGLWSSAGAAGTAVLVAQSAPVATTFFAPSGLLGLIGIGTAATPIGWVITSAVFASAGWMGVMRFLRTSWKKKSTTIPLFINSPINALALALFDLMAPITLKMASSDGKIDPAEREKIFDYFVNDWGFSADFVTAGLEHTEQKLSQFDVRDLADALSKLKKTNKDCNHKEMTSDFLEFLTDVLEADGIRDPREKRCFDEVRQAFSQAGFAFPLRLRR